MLMKRMLLPVAKILAVLSALTLASFYVWYTQKSANPEEEVLSSDGYTIDLNLAPEVKEFEGFINYDSPIIPNGVDEQGRPVQFILGPKSIPQPVFSTRKVAQSEEKQPEVHFVKQPTHGLKDANMLEQRLVSDSSSGFSDDTPSRRLMLSGSKSGRVDLPVQMGGLVGSKSGSGKWDLGQFLDAWTNGFQFKSPSPGAAATGINQSKDAPLGSLIEGSVSGTASSKP